MRACWAESKPLKSSQPIALTGYSAGMIISRTNIIYKRRRVRTNFPYGPRELSAALNKESLKPTCPIDHAEV